MTNGTSQGLFVVVAIVIFGIFVGLTYTLFGSEGLSNDLENIFTEGMKGASVAVSSPFKVTVSDNEDGSKTIKAFNQNKSVQATSIQYLSKQNGQNLLKNSNFVEPLIYASLNYGVTWHTRGGVNLEIDTETLIDNQPTLKSITPSKTTNPDETVDYFIGLNGSVSKGDVITISFYAKSLENTQFDVRFGVNQGQMLIESVNLDSEFKRYSVTLENQGKQNNNIVLRSIAPTTIWMSKIQIEYGDVATEWKPFALDNLYNKETESLELVTDRNGTYRFKMVDSDGKEYLEEVTITDF